MDPHKEQFYKMILNSIRKHGIIYIPNTPDEILEGCFETMKLIEDDLSLSYDDKRKQELFWSNYPMICEQTGVVKHASPPTPIVSPYFLRKHAEWLLS